MNTAYAINGDWLLEKRPAVAQGKNPMAMGGAGRGWRVQGGGRPVANTQKEGGSSSTGQLQLRLIIVCVNKKATRPVLSPFFPSTHFHCFYTHTCQPQSLNTFLYTFFTTPIPRSKNTSQLSKCAPLLSSPSSLPPPWLRALL